MMNIMETNYKITYASASIHDLKLALNSIETDIRAEQEALEEANDFLEMQDIKRTISELNHEAAYVAELIDLYNETQLNTLENQSNE